LRGELSAIFSEVVLQPLLHILMKLGGRETSNPLSLFGRKIAESAEKACMTLSPFFLPW